ncbi:hypothetical protein Avbf_10158 [Armadillidium vulgare]|nr:hypothetical protein Avbf_10158 [Armadillidium vulgare]
MKIKLMCISKDPKSKSMANHIHSNSYTYTAFTYSKEGQLPFLLANFGSGDNKGNHKKELEKMLQTQEVKKYKGIQRSACNIPKLVEVNMN